MHHTAQLRWVPFPERINFVLPSQLAASVHYYLCKNHADMNMKGDITVKQISGTQKLSSKPNISIYHNPSSGKLNISRTNNLPLEIEIFYLLGERVYWSQSTEQNIIIE